MWQAFWVSNAFWTKPKNLKLRGSKPILCTKDANSDTKLCMCLPISPINQFLVLNPIWYLPVKKHHVLVKMTLLGSILTKNGHKMGQNGTFWQTRPFFAFLEENQHILRYYMIVYAIIKENPFLTPSPSQIGLKILNKSNSLNVPLDMTHSYHLTP